MADQVSVAANRFEELRSRQAVAWRRGKRLSVESLIGAVGTLHDDKFLELIYAEALLRGEHGELVAVDEYVLRFPKLAEGLRRLFAVHDVLKSPETSADGVHNRPARQDSWQQDNADAFMENDRLDELLSLWQQSYETGRVISADELCRECPELLPRVAQRIEEVRQAIRLALTVNWPVADDSLTLVKSMEIEPRDSDASTPFAFTRRSRTMLTGLLV